MVAIVAGDAHSVALKSDGTLVAWGNNDRGQATIITDNFSVGLSHGTVTSNPAGINCPGNGCVADFAAGTGVVLSAQADPGWIFSGWSGDCSGMGDCPLDMDGEKKAVATFATWKVNRVDPTIKSAIDWPVTVHGPVNPGEYLAINGTIYGVGFSGNCSWISDSNCQGGGPGNYNFADLQQVNQIDGSLLWQDSPANTLPLRPDLTGTEGQAITHYATWPGPQTTWTVNRVDPEV